MQFAHTLGDGVVIPLGVGYEALDISPAHDDGRRLGGGEELAHYHPYVIPARHYLVGKDVLRLSHDDSFLPSSLGNEGYLR